MRSKIIILMVMLLFLTGCTKNMCTVTFNTGMGDSSSISIKKGDILKDITEPKKDGYLFVNWLKNGIEYDLGKPVSEDIILTANWVKKPSLVKTYNITFIMDDKIDKTSACENETINEPKHKEKKNYIFLGWYVGDLKYDFSSKVTKDMILTAKYKLDTVKVTYDLDGGVGTNEEVIIRNNTASIPIPPERNGYNFVKWTMDGNDFSFTTKITKDITLKAVWDKIEYVTITFDTDNGNDVEKMIVEKYTKVLELPIPVKDFKKFREWQLDGTLFDIDTVLSKDITLVAIYD